MIALGLIALPCMIKLSLHVSAVRLACLDCMFMLPLQGRSCPAELTGADQHPAHTAGDETNVSLSLGAPATSNPFPPNNFKHFLTLFSKFFSSFPHGTCSLSVSRQYLALDGTYHLLWAAFPNNPTLRKRLVKRQRPRPTGFSPSRTPPSRARGGDFQVRLFPVRSPQKSRSSPLETLDVNMPQAGCCVAVGLGYGCLGVGTPRYTLPRLVYALEFMMCMLSRHCAIGLQTDCMVIVLAPVVEAARLPRVCPMALGYRLPPL